MATVTQQFGSGGSNLVPGGSGGSPSAAEVLRDIADDMTELRAKLILLLAKLDADAGVTDTDYAATLTPAVLKHVKG